MKVVRATLGTLVALIGVSYVVPNMPGVYDQQSIGACVWMATTGCYHIKTGVHLSALCGYYFDRCWQGLPTVDCGSDSQNAIYIVKNVGVCRDELMPFNNAIVDSSGNAIAPPFPDGIRDAANHKMPDSSWLACETPDDLEAALKSGDGRSVTMFGSAVSSDIQSYQKGQVLGAPDATDIIGGHETTIVGVIYRWEDTAKYPEVFGALPVRPTLPDGTLYRDGDRLWLDRNSWSADYGYNGHFLCTDAFLFNDTALGSHFALMQAA
jgi:hypothetical protein